MYDTQQQIPDPSYYHIPADNGNDSGVPPQPVPAPGTDGGVRIGGGRTTLPVLDASGRPIGPIADTTPAPGAQSPLQPAYVTAPFASPTYANDQFATDPRFAIAQILKGFAPQAARSTATLNDTLASMGISGGGAVDAQTGLQGELAAGIAPALASAYGQYSGNSLQQTLANMSAANQATGMNTQNAVQTGEFNAGSYNSMQMQLAQMLEQEYGLQAGALTNLISQGLSGQTGVNQGAQANAGALASGMANNFPVYQAPNLSGLSTALGGLNAPKVPTVPIPGTTGTSPTGGG